ncbi:MAG: hypothetical protein EZS28_009288 [Streblomastix strix]|uniref:Uncharacterized protein n=1 Tax=Streblomastix strix TaxID=222440 RepID=A0A5J4WJK3_9EUKA|nr:MAG: hypothetical protein EZS28_009288 [Streblomastix strix]
MPLSQFGIRQRQQLMKKKLIDPNKFQQKPKIEFGDDGAAQMLLEQAQLMDIQEYLINMNNNPGKNNQIDNYSNDYEQQDSDSESNNKDIETDTDDLEYDIASDDLTSSNSEEQEFLDFYR